MTSQLNVDTIVDKAGSGGTNVKVANTSTYVSDGGNVTQDTVRSLIKAWFNVNQESTQAFRDSLNFSSLSDQGTGATQMNYTNAFTDDGYAAGGMGKDASGGGFAVIRMSNPVSSTQFQFLGEDASDTNIDCHTATGMMSGDLA